MFYQPGVTDHGLPRDPFKVGTLNFPILNLPDLTPPQACVVPRPIGWISTKSSFGIDNLAPYSQFNNLTFDPPYVMFSANQTSSGHRKDTVTNAETAGEFVWNLATYPLREAVNITAEEVPFGVDEFQRAGLQKEKANIVNVNMVKESPVKFECKYHSTLRLPGNPPVGTVDVVIGLVIGVHVDERVLTDGMVDISKTEPIARCGYFQYARIRETFEMVIPGDKKLLFGLEGSAKLYRELKDEMAEKAEGNGENAQS